MNLFYYDSALSVICFSIIKLNGQQKLIRIE